MFSPGTGLLWIPGFVLGQVIAWIGNIFFGQELLMTDGFGILPQFFVAIGTIAFSVLGLWFVHQMLKLWFDQKIAALTTVTLFLTTHLFYYTAMDPVNSHSGSFLLASILIYQFSKFLKTRVTWQKMVALGLVSGMLVLVRNQDLVVVLPILVAIILSKKANVLDKINWLVLFGGTAFVILSIQLFSTITLFGVFGSPYLLRGQVFHWTNPNFIRALFSSGDGLFFFAPILIVSIAYLIAKVIKKATTLPLVALAVFLLQLYVVAIWVPQMIGGPYGSRMFISILPFLSIGIAYFIENLMKKMKNRNFWMLFTIIIFVLFANMAVQTFIMLNAF